jgi:hypothetical protein
LKVKVGVPVNEFEEYVGLGCDVVDGGRAVADLAPQQIVENGSDVLLALEVDSGNVVDHDLDQIGVVDLLRELRNHLRLRLLLVRAVQDVLDARDALGHVVGDLFLT